MMKFHGNPLAILILRKMDVDRASKFVEEALEMGLRNFEVSMLHASDLNTMSSLRRRFGTEAIIGSGTIIDTRGAVAAIARGTDFLFSPATSVGIARLARVARVPYIPGVATPSDVAKAIGLGCTLLKAFPASLLSPEWIRALSGPFPSAEFIATGGVTSANMQDFIAAGACGVAFGSSVAGRTDMAGIAARLKSGKHV